MLNTITNKYLHLSIECTHVSRVENKQSVLQTFHLLGKSLTFSIYDNAFGVGGFPVAIINIFETD